MTAGYTIAGAAGPLRAAAGKLCHGARLADIDGHVGRQAGIVPADVDRMRSEADPMTTPTDIAAWRVALGSPDVAVRVDAAEHLCRAGTAAAPAVADLVRACGDGDDQVREWAGAALEELGPPPTDTLAHLVPLVEAAAPLSAYWAVTLLGRAGAAAAAALPVLTRRLAGPGDPAVRQRVAWALGKIGPDAPAREALTQAAAEPDPRLARLAAEALAAAG